MPGNLADSWEMSNTERRKKSENSSRIVHIKTPKKSLVSSICSQIAIWILNGHNNVKSCNPQTPVAINSAVNQLTKHCFDDVFVKALIITFCCFFLPRLLGRKRLANSQIQLATLEIVSSNCCIVGGCSHS